MVGRGSSIRAASAKSKIAHIHNRDDVDRGAQHLANQGEDDELASGEKSAGSGSACQVFVLATFCKEKRHRERNG